MSPLMASVSCLERACWARVGEESPWAAGSLCELRSLKCWRCESSLQTGNSEWRVLPRCLLGCSSIRMRVCKSTHTRVLAALRALCRGLVFHESTRLFSDHVLTREATWRLVLSPSPGHSKADSLGTRSRLSEIRRQRTLVSNVGEQANKIRTLACQAASRKQIALSNAVIWGEES